MEKFTYKLISKSQFPVTLLQSKFCPNQLSLAGKLPQEPYYGLAMVGTRRPGNNAPELCKRLIHSLQGTDTVVISGLAQGIDSLCHEAALEAGLPTIAVLGQGLGTPINGSRGELAQRIVESGGAVISQFDPKEPSYKGYFVARNRTIAALSHGTIVIQSKAKGGALITADFCRQMGKPLYAIPGDFDNEVHSGTNMLLDKGLAAPLFCPESICSTLGIVKKPGLHLDELKACGCELSENAKQFFSKVNSFRKTFDNLMEEWNYTPNQLLAILTELEMAGLARTEDNFLFYFNGVP